MEVGQVAIVRFPHDAVPVPAVAKIRALRGDQALVSKRRGLTWGKPRWVPSNDIARQATDRERVVGMPIDPIPPRAA